MKRTKKIKKRSLTASVIVLCLCVAALIGGTFAWFTDTASTGVNKIQAGTLDVALQMKNSSGNWVSAEGESLSWQKASGATESTVLWEPGCSYVTNEFQIVNNGSLALKYTVAVTGFDSSVSGSAKLLEAIEFYLVDESGTTTTETALASFDGHLTANATAGPYKIKGHMKEEAGNEYQGLSIDNISITVRATQDTVESDSFSTTYDENATYPILASVFNETRSGETDTSSNIVIESQNATSTVTSGIQIKSAEETGTGTATLSNESITEAGNLTRTLKTTQNTADSVTYDISYTYTKTSTSASSTTSTTYDVSEFSGVVTNVIQLSTGLKNVKVTHTHGSTTTEMTAADSETANTDGYFFYNSTTGKLTVWSSKYSAFKVSFDSDYEASVNGQGYNTLAEAIAVAQTSGKAAVMVKDVQTTGSLFIEADTILNLNGKTISADPNNWTQTVTYGAKENLQQRAIFFVKSGAKFTINDPENKGVIDASTNSYLSQAVMLTIVENNDTSKTAELEVNGGTLKGYWYGICTNGSRPNTKITVNGGVITGSVGNTSGGTAIYHPSTGPLTITGGTFTGYDGIVIKGGTDVNISGGTFTGTGKYLTPEEANVSGSNSTGSALYVEDNYNYAPVVNITGGTFTTVDKDAPAVRLLFNGTPSGTISISGGTFSSDPTTYVAKGYAAKKVSNTEYTITSLWTAKAADSFASIDTSAKTISIQTPAQLALLAKNINNGANYAGYTITIDGTLDMSQYMWVPMQAFKCGSLAGATIVGADNATISGLDINKAAYNVSGAYSYYAGFIAQAAGGLTIKDITFAGASSVDNGSGVAIVLGQTYGSVTMENVVVKDSTITAETKAGAFVGFTGGDGIKVTLKNCKTENVTVNASYSYALMIGLVNIYDSAELTGCSSTGCTLNYTGGYDETKTVGELTYGVSDTNLWLINPNGAWVEKRSNPSPTTVIDQVTYTIKGDKVLYTNGTVGED